MRKLYCLSLCIAIMATFGCKDSGTSDEKERRKPLVKKGDECVQNRQWDEAEKAYLEALKKDPELAVPHLELARIYREYDKNLIYSIYHYDRYLELRPDAPNAEDLKFDRNDVQKQLENEVMQACDIAELPDVKNYVAKVNQEAKAVVQRQTSALQAENTKLKQQLLALQRQQNTTTASSGNAQSSGGRITRTTRSSNSNSKTHTVKKGETLGKIATEYYGSSSQWVKIYNANKDTVPDPNRVRPGQTLIIP